jgi:general stress protein YciG
MPNENDPKQNSGEQGSTSQGQHRTWHEHQVSGQTDETARPMGSTGEMRDDTGAQPSTAQGTSTGSTQPQQPRQKQRRGFAAMDPAKQKEIASKGGKASHALGTGHEWNSETAREAGRKGGQASRGGRGKLTNSGGSEGGGTAE